MQGRAVLLCHSKFDCLFLPEPVSCRGQRIARSNGKRNRSFTKNITIFAAVVEVLILIAMFFLFFFFLKYCISKHLCAPHGARIHRPKCIWPTEDCKKKNGYHFMKNCNASTHQPAHRKICLTLIMCIDVHFRSIFLSTFNIFKHIFIDFMVLLHWTTQQNKSASLRFRLTWQFLKKKKKKKKKKKHGKVCQARVVRCCPAILLLSFFFFFYLIQTKKKRRERSKSNLWKGMTKTNVCCNAVPETQPPSSIDQAQGINSCKLMLLFCTFTIIHPACLLPPPASRITLLQLLRPQYAMKLGYCQCCFLQSDEQKKCKNAWIMNYKKHNTDTKTCFPRYSKFHAKERSSDRSPVWRSL